VLVRINDFVGGSMDKRFLKNVAALSLSTAVAGLLGQACNSSPANAQTPETRDPIEGAWTSQVTITDCHGTTTRQFQSLNLFHDGGTLTDTDSQPPASHGPALGTWSSQGSATYGSLFQLYRFNADWTLAGSNRVQRTITLSADGNSFTSTIAVSLLDPTGTQVGSGCGTETATRLK
jgi:hypothetical protein